MADVAARHYGALTAGVRLGLGAADLVHGLVGTGVMKGTLDGLRKASRRALAEVVAGAGAAGALRAAADAAAARRARRLLSQLRGAQHGRRSAATTAWRCCPAWPSGCSSAPASTCVYPAALAGQCCGQPFESKGLVDAADLKSAELEAALREASEGGRWPIVFDTSPCAYRMKKFVAGRLAMHDSIEFVHDALLPRLHLTPQPQAVAVHPVCSVRKMGSVDKLMAIAARCSAEVVTVRRGAVLRLCRRARLHAARAERARAAPPEGRAARGLQAGYSSSRTCEIGLSEMAGMPYQSILYLVERCSAGAAPR